MEENYRTLLKNRKRIVIKVGSSSLAHKETGKLDLGKLEVLVRMLSDLRFSGKDVVLVSSGAVMAGRNSCRLPVGNYPIAKKQAFASIGQAKLMMVYQKLFSEYNQLCSQILITKNTLVNKTNRQYARATFDALFDLDVIPIVNENDTISTEEIVFGDNDTLSACVAAMIDADLLILLSDIDGLYTDDPNRNPEAEMIHFVDELDAKVTSMAKGASSDVGTGGMQTKMQAAKIAVDSGCDMVIANGEDFHIISKIINGEECGTLFSCSEKDPEVLRNVLEGDKEWTL